MTRSCGWDATSLAWLIKRADVEPQQPEPVGVFFGFRGMPATISITRADGVYVEGVKVEPQEPQHGDKDVPQDQAG